MFEDVKEFVADTSDEAVAKAVTHYGVEQGKLRVHVVPDSSEVSGLGGRSLIIVSISDEPEELSPVGEFLDTVLSHMGTDGVRISESQGKEGEQVFTLRGTGIMQLDSRDSRVLPSLSHLVERVAEKLKGEGSSARVELAENGCPAARDRGDRGDRERGGRERGGRGRGDRDGDGRRGDNRGRDTRGPRPEIDEAGLEKEARDAAAKVRDDGESLVMREMNSRERWVIHNALKDESGVRSESEGEGRARRVKLVPA